MVITSETIKSEQSEENSIIIDIEKLKKQVDFLTKEYKDLKKEKPHPNIFGSCAKFSCTITLQSFLMLSNFCSLVYTVSPIIFSGDPRYNLNLLESPTFWIGAIGSTIACCVPFLTCCTFTIDDFKKKFIK